MSEVSLAAKVVGEGTISIDSDSLNTNFGTDYTFTSKIDLTNYSMVEKDLTLKIDPVTKDSQSIKAEESPNSKVKETVNEESLADRINNLPLNEASALVLAEGSPEAKILLVKRLIDMKRRYEAKAILGALAKDGHKEAQKLYVRYTYDVELFKDKFALKLCKALIKEGEPNAMENLANAYRIEGKPIKAAKLFEKALKKREENRQPGGVGSNAHFLGMLWEGSDGHPVNLIKARDYFKKGADLDNVSCAWGLRRVEEKIAQEDYQKSLAKLAK